MLIQVEARPSLLLLTYIGPFNGGWGMLPVTILHIEMICMVSSIVDVWDDVYVYDVCMG